MVTSTKIKNRKGKKKISMLTAYDATFAKIFDEAGVDILLVGDSLGMVIQGHQNTIPVKLEHSIYHTKAVSRVVKNAQVLGDMPFMSYATTEKAMETAGRLVQEGGAHAVKLEGGMDMVWAVKAIVKQGIPVCGHIGLTPQSIHRLGGFKVQGRSEEDEDVLMNSAVCLQDAGCYALVLESIPAELAKKITVRLEIPTIGIGAGPSCDGQVLVCYDMLGMDPSFNPKFVKKYAQLHEQITGATKSFIREISEGGFPDNEHSF